MFKLSISDVFLKDYNKFQEEISKIDDIDLKSELNGLLRKLRAEVQKIDNHHAEMNPFNHLGQKTSDVRNTIYQIRESISIRLADYKRANRN